MNGYSYTVHLQALAELTRLDRHVVWASMYARANKSIDDFVAKYGKSPDEGLSIVEVAALAGLPVQSPEALQHVGLLEKALKPMLRRE